VVLAVEVEVVVVDLRMVSQLFVSSEDIVSYYYYVQIVIIMVAVVVELVE
jgi:hypothetical protein